MNQSILKSLATLVLLLSPLAQAKVYSNIPIKKYKVSYDLDQYKGQTFLKLMMDEIYPALERESGNQRASNHINGVSQGEGVELRLSADVSTYHVKFKAGNAPQAERSGRSFSAVGRADRPAYVADASYKHYLTELEKVVKGDKQELSNFYRAIVSVVANCDASGFNQLGTQAKRVAADFVAVYIAEQYRHMISGRGKLGNSHNWDDALFQVTLLAGFHGGQNSNNAGMFYEGVYTNQIYDQFICAYNQPANRDNNKLRPFKLVDYWQFGKTCSRSGVNVTRRDFQMLGSFISDWSNDEDDSDATSELKQALRLKTRDSRNLIRAISLFFINNSAPTQLSDAGRIVNSIVEFVMHTNRAANQITATLTNFKGRSGDSEYAEGNEESYFDATLSDEEKAANKASLEDEDFTLAEENKEDEKK